MRACESDGCTACTRTNASQGPDDRASSNISDTSSTEPHPRARAAVRAEFAATRESRATEEPAAIDTDELAQVVEDFTLVEFRRTGDAIGEHVRNLERAAVVRLRNHFETDLETDRIEFDALERSPANE